MPHCDGPSHGSQRVLAQRECRNTACCFASFSATPTIFQVSFVLFISAGAVKNPTPVNHQTADRPWQLPRTFEVPSGCLMSNWFAQLDCPSASAFCAVFHLVRTGNPFRGHEPKLHSHPSRHTLFVSMLRTGCFISLAGVQVCTFYLRSTVMKLPFGGTLWVCMDSPILLGEGL